MKYLPPVTTFLLCLPVLLLLAQSISKSHAQASEHINTQKLQLVVLEFCPVFCFKNNQFGDLKKVMVELYAEQNVKVTHVTLPMARAFKEVLEGRYDGIINPDHSALLTLTRTEKTIYDMKICSYNRTDSSWSITTDPHMTSLRLGLVKDYNYSSYSKQLSSIVSLASRENRVEYIVPFSQPDTRNFRKLLAGRIDTTITSHAVARYLIELNQWQNRIKVISCFEKTLPTYIWFAPNRPNSNHYKKLFDNNIDRFKQQDFYKSFIQTYQASE